MTTGFLNDRDVLLQAAPVRNEDSSSRALLLTANAMSFHVSAAGVGTPSSIVLNALLLGMTGTTRTLAFSDMATDSCVVNATTTVDGVAYASPLTINKITDGISPVRAQITSVLANFTAYSDGVIDAAQTFPTTMSVYIGTVDDTANWTISSSSSDASITTIDAGAVVTVDGIGTGVDSGYVDITATRTGYPTQVLRMGVMKTKRTTPSSGLVVSLSGMDLNTAASGAPAVATLTFNSDGSINTGTNWFEPNVAGAGTGRYIKATVITTNGYASGFGGTYDAWISLSAGQTFTMTDSVVGNTASANILIQTSPNASGTPVIGTGYSYLLANRTS